MQTLEQLSQELVTEACRDEVGLWLIVRAVRDDLLVQAPEDVKATCLEVVRRMLESRRVEAGHYKPDGSGVVRWKSPTSSVLSKISAEWTLLGREPDIGEVVVFVAAEAGQQPVE
jgi:hypothetical protein